MKLNCILFFAKKWDLKFTFGNTNINQFFFFSTTKFDESKTLNESDKTFIQKVRLNDKKKLKNLKYWQKKKLAIFKKYGKWSPTNKISRNSFQNIKFIKKNMPEINTLSLSKMFNLNPESIIRILKSNLNLPHKKKNHNENLKLDIKKNRNEKKGKILQFSNFLQNSFSKHSIK